MDDEDGTLEPKGEEEAPTPASGPTAETSTELRPAPWWVPGERTAIAGLVVTIALLVVAGVWEYFTTLALAACATWLVAAVGLPRSPLYDRLLSLGRGRLVLLVLILALAVRWVMLLQENPGGTMAGAGEVSMRGERLLAGDVPYQDFPVRKPPMYLYMCGGIVGLMGTSVEGVRFVLSLLDALVAVVLLLLASQRFSGRAGVHAGLLYAVFPVGVFSVGIAGHYDGLVVLVTMLGLLLYQGGRLHGAMLMMGLGFAFKLYPAVLVPWLLWRESGWRRRATGVAAFAAPMALSWVPMLLLNPSALSQYIGWQSTWLPVKSISYGAVHLAGWAGDSAEAVAAGQVVTWAFLLLLVAMFLDWVRRRVRDPDGHVRDWFRVVATGFVGWYVVVIAGSVVDYRVELLGLDHRASGWLVLALLAAVGAAGLLYLLRRILTPWPQLEDGERLVVVLALSVSMLLLSSSQGNPWYLVWLFSLLLLVQEERLRSAFMALGIWNVEDAGVALWPGLRFHGNSPI